MKKIQKFCEKLMWSSVLLAALTFPYIAANYSML